MSSFGRACMCSCSLWQVNERAILEKECPFAWFVSVCSVFSYLWALIEFWRGWLVRSGLLNRRHRLSLRLNFCLVSRDLDLCLDRQIFLIWVDCCVELYIGARAFANCWLLALIVGQVLLFLFDGLVSDIFWCLVRLKLRQRHRQTRLSIKKWFFNLALWRLCMHLEEARDWVAVVCWLIVGGIEASSFVRTRLNVLLDLALRIFNCLLKLRLEYVTFQLIVRSAWRSSCGCIAA